MDKDLLLCIYQNLKMKRILLTTTLLLAIFAANAQTTTSAPVDKATQEVMQKKADEERTAMDWPNIKKYQDDNTQLIAAAPTQNVWYLWVILLPNFGEQTTRYFLLAAM